MKRFLTILMIAAAMLMLVSCGEKQDPAITAAVDSYMRIVTQNDATALDELPPQMWDVCEHSPEEYKQYMQDNPPDTVSDDVKWMITSVENPLDNMFDVVIKSGDEEYTITLTKEDEAFIIDELVIFFNSLSFEMENRPS